MSDYDFSLVEAAVIDPQRNSLDLVRDLLMRFGVKRVETFTSTAEAQTLLTAVPMDLILLDADSDPGAFRFIRSFRNEPASPNPFAPLVVTSWQPTATLVTRVTNSGADDLLIKPVSPKQFMERLACLIEVRKKFVVTADYFGPDRRKSSRDGTQVPLLDIPNTLRLKATRVWQHANVRQIMATAAAQLSEQKVLRSSVQVAFLIEAARPGLAGPTPERQALDHLGRVPAVLDEMTRRLPLSDACAATKACQTLKAQVESLRGQAETGEVDGDETDSALALAYELMQIIDSKRTLESMKREVTVAVSDYRARLDRLVSARTAVTKGQVKMAAQPAGDPAPAPGA
jgi:DNA-binding response OmpR family regulator